MPGSVDRGGSSLSRLTIGDLYGETICALNGGYTDGMSVGCIRQDVRAIRTTHLAHGSQPAERSPANGRHHGQWISACARVGAYLGRRSGWPTSSMCACPIFS